MALTGAWGSFVHIPKCGGLAMRRILQSELGRGVESRPYHGVPPDITDGFALIRHPVSWLRSIWTYRHNDAWRINPKAVNYWPVIVGLTQWAAGLSWDDFIAALVKYQIDIPLAVYGMYKHPNVKIYRLEQVGVLLSELGINTVLPHVHETPNKPEITPQQQAQLEWVCNRSIKEYGYA